MGHTYIVEQIDPEGHTIKSTVSDVHYVRHSDIAPGYIDLFDADGNLDCSFREVVRIYRKSDQPDDVTVKVSINGRDFAGAVRRSGADRKGR